MYSLTLTEEDARTIGMVSYRYGWSSVLERLSLDVPGTHDVPEHEAWEIKFECELDTEGGHSFFPMLNHSSELARKLFALLDSII